MKVYSMGECGVAVTVQVCSVNNRPLVVSGWHEGSEKEARQRLIDKLENIKQSAQNAINKLTN